MKNWKPETIDTLTLALCIAVFPPLWAVAAPFLNVNTGAIALICAGVYVTNGNKTGDALKISAGFLLGDVWACLAMWIMDRMALNPNAELYVTLFVLGGLAVLTASAVPGWIHLPSWLCGWAIALLTLGMAEGGYRSSYPLQIAVSMLAGVWYVGVFMGCVQKKLADMLGKKA